MTESGSGHEWYMICARASACADKVVLFTVDGIMSVYYLWHN